MRKRCYDCARAEWDSEGATGGINGLHVDRPSLGCNKRISKKRMTNGDRVRAMTDEELADVLQGQCVCCAYQLTGCTEKECKDGALSWVKQEVGEGGQS